MTSLPFGDTLLLWRRAKRLTQAQVAARARIPQPNLSDIERGRREVSLATLRALAGALGVRPGVLADGTAPGAAAAQPLSRAAMERIAAAAAGRGVVASEEARALVEQLRRLVQHRVGALKRQQHVPRRSARAASIAWIELESRYPKAVINSLARRTLEWVVRA